MTSGRGCSQVCSSPSVTITPHCCSHKQREECVFSVFSLLTQSVHSIICGTPCFQYVDAVGLVWDANKQNMTAGFFLQCFISTVGWHYQRHLAGKTQIHYGQMCKVEVCGLSPLRPNLTTGNRKQGSPTKMQDGLRVPLEGCWDYVHWRMTIWYWLTQVYLEKCRKCFAVLLPLIES